MATGAQTWSTSAASNNSADGSVNWAEGMAPSAVNNSARAEMASMAMWLKDNSGTLLTSGSTSAYTVTSKQVSTAVVDGYTIAVNFHATNDASATLNVDGVGAKQIQLVPGTNLSGGEFVAGTSHRFHYSSSSTAWIAQGPNLIGASGVSSNQIAAGAVAYSKIQNETAGTILGNGSGSAAAPAELTIGTGLLATSSSISAPAFPPQSAYKNLSIKVTGTTSATVAADFVTLATSGSSAFITLPVASNINFGTSGLDALDAGSLSGNNTHYAVYAIATSTSSAAHGLASTSFTSPTMPSTAYVYKARVGAVVTTTTTGTAALHGTWQFGRKVQFVLGLAGTTVVPLLKSTSSTSFVPADTSPFVPTTASDVYVSCVNSNGAAVNVVAPSTSYAISVSATLNAPIYAVAGGNGVLTLESTNIWVGVNAGTGTFLLNGYVDNI